MTNAWLNGATLSGAHINAASLTGASLVGASLNGTVLTNSALNGANFTNVNFSDANLTISSEWFESVLTDPNYRDTSEKLLSVDASERHVFLMSGGRTGFEVESCLQRVDHLLPTKNPKVPNGITHLWGLPQYGATRAAL